MNESKMEINLYNDVIENKEYAKLFKSKSTSKKLNKIENMEVDTDSKRCCEKSEPNFSTENLEILYSIASNIDISDIAKYSKIFKHNLINLKFDFEFSNINLDCLKLNTQQWLLKNFFLDNYNLVYFKIKGDGNFFFRAICLFFLGD